MTKTLTLGDINDHQQFQLRAAEMGDGHSAVGRDIDGGHIDVRVALAQHLENNDVLSLKSDKKESGTKPRH